MPTPRLRPGRYRVLRRCAGNVSGRKTLMDTKQRKPKAVRKRNTARQPSEVTISPPATGAIIGASEPTSMTTESLSTASRSL